MVRAAWTRAYEEGCGPSCRRRAPSHTVQSCVSGPFGALEPNGAYSGGAPHTPRWRQVDLESISSARGTDTKFAPCATFAIALLGAPLPHHAVDAPHRRHHRTAPYHESAGLRASSARVSQRPSVGGAHLSSPRFHMGARTTAGQISAGLPVTRGTSVFGPRT